MLRITITLCCLVVLSLAMAGCASYVEGDIYLRDLDELTAEGLTSRLYIHVPLPSLDECAEYQQRYDNIWSQSDEFQGMEFEQCHEEGWDNYLQYNLSVPLRSLDPVGETASMQAAIEVIQRTTDDGHRALYLRVDPVSLDQVDTLLYDEFFEHLDFSDNPPLLRISNDLRESQTLVVAGAFVQNEPVLTPEAFTLEPRDTLEIVLSDVASAWLFKPDPAGSPRIALIGIWTSSD